MFEKSRVFLFPTFVSAITNVSISFRLVCITTVVPYVFLIDLAREIGVQAPKMNPPCVCPTFDRCVGLVCMCNEPAILPPDIVLSVSVAMFVWVRFSSLKPIQLLSNTQSETGGGGGGGGRGRKGNRIHPAPSPSSPSPGTPVKMTNKPLSECYSNCDIPRSLPPTALFQRKSF